MMGKDKKIGQSKRSAKYGLFSMVGHTIGLGMKKRPLLPPLFFLIYIGMGIAATANTFVKQLFFESVEDLVAGRVQYAVVAGYGILVCLFPALILAVRTANNAITMTFYGVTLGYMGEQLNAKAGHAWTGRPSCPSPGKDGAAAAGSPPCSDSRGMPWARQGK